MESNHTYSPQTLAEIQNRIVQVVEKYRKGGMRKEDFDHEIRFLRKRQADLLKQYESRY